MPPQRLTSALVAYYTYYYYTIYKCQELTLLSNDGAAEVVCGVKMRAWRRGWLLLRLEISEKRGQIERQSTRAGYQINRYISIILNIYYH